MANRIRGLGQSLSAAGAVTPLWPEPRRSQVLVIDGIKAMVVLHTCQGPIKISNYFGIIALLSECQIARDFVDRRRKFLDLVQVSLLPRGFENDMSIPHRQI